MGSIFHLSSNQPECQTTWYLSLVTSQLHDKLGTVDHGVKPQLDDVSSEVQGIYIV